MNNFLQNFNADNEVNDNLENIFEIIINYVQYENNGEFDEKDFTRINGSILIVEIEDNTLNIMSDYLKYVIYVKLKDFFLNLTSFSTYSKNTTIFKFFKYNIYFLKEYESNNIFNLLYETYEIFIPKNIFFYDYDYDYDKEVNNELIKYDISKILLNSHFSDLKYNVKEYTIIEYIQRYYSIMKIKKIVKEAIKK
jgi:hypothetical protein